MTRRPFAKLARRTLAVLAVGTISFGAYAYHRMLPILLECELSAASSDGDTARVERLLKAGVNPSETYAGFGPWELAEAYAGHHLHELQRHPPLIYAIDGGHTKIAMMLIAHGADVNDSSNSHWNCGLTPLMAAVGANDIDLARILIAHGADVNARYKDGTTVFDSRRYPYDARLTKLLLEAGAKSE